MNNKRPLYNKRVGDPSSEFWGADGERRFCEKVQARIDRAEHLWNEFVKFMLDHEATPEEFRRIFMRYHEEFIK